MGVRESLNGRKNLPWVSEDERFRDVLACEQRACSQASDVLGTGGWELALSVAILNFPRTLLCSCDPLFGVLIGLFSCAPA